MLRGEPAEVLIYRNAAFYSISAVAGRGITGALAHLNSGLLALPGAAARPAGARASRRRAVQATVLFNPQLSQEWFLEALLQPGTLHVLLMSALVVVALGRGVALGGLHAGTGGPAGALRAGFHRLAMGRHGLAVRLARLGRARQPATAAAGAVRAVRLLCRIGRAGGAGAARHLHRAVGRGAVRRPGDDDLDATLPVAGGPLFTQLWSQALPFSAYIKLQMEQMFMGSPASIRCPGWAAWPRSASSLSCWPAGSSHGAAAGPCRSLWHPRPWRGHRPAPPSAPSWSTACATPCASCCITRPALVILVLAGLVYGFY